MVNYAASLPVTDTIPTFTLHQVTEIEVLHSIYSLRSKGTGIDNIPASILKLASTSVIAELTAVVNKSIELSYFPSSWKKAVITPLSKTFITIGHSSNRSAPGDGEGLGAYGTSPASFSPHLSRTTRCTSVRFSTGALHPDRSPRSH
ncbi:hypothetical protein TKK_0016817 [Trichogramma kaykai]